MLPTDPRPPADLRTDEGAPLPPPASTPQDAPAAGSPRVIGGVAALLGDRLQIDPLWLRLVFVVLAVFSGLGIVLYLALWLGLVAAPRWGTVGRVAAIAVAIVGCAWIVDGNPPELLSIGGLSSRPLLVAILLGGIALALWHPTMAADRAAAPVAVRAPTPPRERRRRPAPSPLGRSVLGVALLVAAAGALIDRANGGRLHPEQWLGAAAAVCGVGLLVGAFAGHARWLIVPAVLFAAGGWVWGTAARVGVPLNELGDRYVSIGPDTSSGRAHAQTAAGSIFLSVWAEPPTATDVDLSTAFGDVNIQVDSNVTVAIDAAIDRGTTTFSAVDGSSGSPGGLIGPGAVADVVVHVRIGYGDLTVQQIDSTPFPTVQTSTPTTTAAGVDPGTLRFLAVGVGLSDDGMVVVGEFGDVAIIDPAGEVVAGPSTKISESEVEMSLGTGVYRLLARQFLVSPDGSILDLVASRAQFGVTPTSVLATTTVAVG